MRDGVEHSQLAVATGNDAERRHLRSHAERGNERLRLSVAVSSTARTLRSCLAALPLLLLAAQSFAADKLEYNRTIRPILMDNCFACHGADSASRKADLRLDKRDAAMKADAIVPGDAEASEMIRRIGSDDPKEVMPPPMTKKKLTEEQKNLLRQWVQDGAE